VGVDLDYAGFLERPPYARREQLEINRVVLRQGGSDGRAQLSPAGSAGALLKHGSGQLL
jgi:hypothetical protein